MSAWRDYVEEMKDTAEAMVRGVRGERPLTPIVLFWTAEGVVGIAVSPRFFDTPADRAALLGLVIGLMTDYEATRVTWILNSQIDFLRADATHDNHEGIVVISLDREASEVWSTRLHRFEDTGTAIGVWTHWPPNESHGDLLTPLQEALR